jgi:hypothetical protein
MGSSNKEKLDLFLSFYNTDAKVIYNNKEYSLNEDDFNKINSPGNYWHHKKDPSSWLCVETVQHTKKKFGKDLPDDLIIELSAKTLNINKIKLQDALKWNANYMVWHDGGKASDYYPLKSMENNK